MNSPTIIELTCFKKLSQQHTVRLMSGFSRKAHATSRISFFFVCNVFFQHIDVKSTSISCKIEVNIGSKFHFSVSFDVFNYFNATNIKNKIILGV